MAVKVDRIELEIQDNSKTVIAGLEKLKKTLGGFKDITNTTGITKMSKQLGELSAAAGKMSGVQKMKGFTRELSDMAAVSKSSLSKTLADEITEIGSADKSIGVLATMATGFELARQKAYDLSEGMTELNGGIANLFNEDIMSFFSFLNTGGQGSGLGTVLSEISTAIGLISTALSGVSTSLEGISTIHTALGGISTALGGISAPVVIATGAIAALIAGLAYVYSTNEQVRNSFSEAVTTLQESFIPMVELITSTVIPDLILGWDAFLETLQPIFDWLEMAFTSIWNDFIIPAIEYLSGEAIPKLTEVFMGIWDGVLVPLGEFLMSILAPAIEWIAEVFTMLWQEVVVPLGQAIGEVLGYAFTALCDIVSQTLIPIIETVILLFQTLWNETLAPICTFLWEVLKPTFVNVFKLIGDIIGNLKVAFKGVIDFVAGVFTADWTRVWNGILGIFAGIGNLIIDVFEGVVNFVIDLINAMVTAVWSAIKGLVNLILDAIADIAELVGMDFDVHIGIDPWAIPKLNIPRIPIPQYATGGYPESGELFYARENGIPEFVGRTGNRTVVANNNNLESGIAAGNAEQNSLLYEQNNLLRELLSKNTTIELDGDTVGRSVDRYNSSKGYSVGGAFANLY